MTETPRLFLITPRIADAAAFAPLLERALAAAEIASLLLRAATPDEHSIKTLARALAPMAQAKGVAVLIENDARLAARLDVDGVHVDVMHVDGLHVDGLGDPLDAALESLRPRKIVGVGRLDGRDAAMAAGERGADYLMFGEPGTAESHEAIRDKVAWWAEIFNVPCVGYARGPDLAGDLAAAGAEFVALCDGLWDAPDEIGATLARVQRDLTREAFA